MLGYDLTAWKAKKGNVNVHKWNEMGVLEQIPVRFLPFLETHCKLFYLTTHNNFLLTEMAVAVFLSERPN